MKQLIRITVLMLGLVGAYASASVPQVPAPDGMPVGAGRPSLQTLPG
ncbi:MAG: hypothetical protein WCA49_10010 [Candidatus Sulfotelmatobacter sp.]